MQEGPAPPLQNRRVFASRDPDLTGAFMASKEFRLELAPRDAKQFDFVANVAYLPGSYLGYIQYGAAATIHVPDVRARDDYWIHLPLRGACEITNNAGSAVCEPGRAVLSSPVGHFTHSEAQSSRLTLSVTRATMLAQLAALLGEAPGRLLEFAPTMDLASGAGARLMRHVELVLSDLGGPEPVTHPLALNMYEQLLLTSLLLSQPSSYTGRLERLATQHAPRQVQRATDFIEAHLHLPITLADVTRASGIPARTLLQRFSDHHGLSPMRYLRDARFARARDALMRPEGNESVTQIAMRWGFTHLGRFATEYRRRFGESPSETVRRGRGRQ